MGLTIQLVGEGSQKFFHMKQKTDCHFGECLKNMVSHTEDVCHFQNGCQNTA
jgi:hypothetical protein